jgi:hypothetical protein
MKKVCEFDSVADYIDNVPERPSSQLQLDIAEILAAPRNAFNQAMIDAARCQIGINEDQTLRGK